jgi:ketosteroid isomerase-like protein
MAAVTAEQALRAVCAAWDAGDPAACAALFTEDGRYEDPLAAEMTGPGEIEVGLGPAMDLLDDVRVTLGTILADGDRAFGEGHFASVLRETGGRFDFAFAALVEMRDGRVARLVEYFDTKPLVG